MQMRFAPGAQLGPYRILSPLGRGGMGDVYLAEDPRLHRQVAIKVLNEKFAADPIGRTRFLREARVAAQLDHPNICALHEIGSAADCDYIVMQRLRGETLAERLRRDAIPPAEALELAIQLTEAVAYAHAEGVIHRDIKPPNVMITPEGRVKLMDFGLGKAIERLADHTTTTGGVSGSEVLGTVEYMAPEQFNGVPADKRSDVFSLGLTLFEMFAGQHPFACETRAATVAAMSTRQAPALTSVAPEAPRALDPVLGKALARDPADRYQTGAELLAALKAVRDGSTRGASPPPWQLNRRWIVGLCLAAAAVAAVIWGVSRFRMPGTASGAAAAITTWVSVTPVRNGDTQATYEAAGDIAVATGWRFRVHIEAGAPGWVYLISDERRHGSDEVSLQVLYPAADDFDAHTRPGPAVFASPGYRLRDPPADTSLWVVWARRPLPELEDLKPVVRDTEGGRVTDGRRADAVRKMLDERLKSVAIDEDARRATARGDGDAVLYRFTLRQQ